MIVFSQWLILMASIIILLIWQSEGWGLIILLLIICIGLAILFFFRTRRLYASQTPYGPTGVMNPRTGIVDPTRSIPKIQRQIDKQANKTSLVWKLTPLSAGLIYAFAKMLSISGKLAILWIATIVLVLADSILIGSLVAYASMGKRK